jgi:hypothetical protein
LKMQHSLVRGSSGHENEASPMIRRRQIRSR